MKKTLSLIFILIVVLSVSAIAQQQQPRTLPFGSPAPTQTGAQPPGPQAATPLPGAVPPKQTPIYTYTGTGTQRWMSEVPPDQFKKDNPTASYSGVVYVNPSEVSIVFAAAEQAGSPPVAAYQGRIVFRNPEKPDKVTIVEGPNTYHFANGNLVSGPPYTTQTTIQFRDLGPIQIRSDETTGEPTFFAGGRQLTNEEVAGLEHQDGVRLARETVEGRAAQKKNAQKLYEQEQARFTQYGSVGQFLETAASYYQQYSGMSGWSALIWDEEYLQEWRDRVNDIMCKTIILGGVDCWASKICGKYSDIKPTRDGVLYSDAGTGAPRAVAHIEGERSLPIVTPGKTQWVYTITFSVTNPDEDKGLSYNVRFIGPKHSARWWTPPVTNPPIDGGGTVSVTGASALQKLSSNDYTEVCLELSPSIKGWGGKKVSKLCNSIVQYSGPATAPYGAPPNETAAAPTPGAPETPTATPGGSV